MDRYRNFALSAYLVGASLAIIPYFDAAMSLWPWRPSLGQWRFGAIGLVSNAFMLGGLGLLVLLMTAFVFGHWRTLRVLGGLCAASALFTMVAIVLFGLDAIETRSHVDTAVKLSYDVASLTAFVKLSAAFVTLVCFALAGLRTPKQQRARATEAEPFVMPGKARVPEPAPA